MSKAVAQPRVMGLSSGFRVLVVDDDPDMSEFLAHMLRAEGMDATTATDGEEGIAKVHAEAPDLVLLDVMMPGLSGFEVCARLKSDEATAMVPIVLVTALDDSASRVRGIEAGADDFLSKPVRREELVARVKTLRRLHETRRELERRRLAAEVENREAIRRAFSRYISPRLAERILEDDGADGELFSRRAQRVDVVALFADLRGFTSITERTEVVEVVAMLNEYFSILTDAAYHHDATIFNMAGDSLLVGFNVPFPQEDAAKRSFLTAEEMVSRFAPVAMRWEQRYGVATGVGVGICMGEAILANVGSPHYTSYTIIGNPVNTAARLMQTAPANEVLMCSSVYDKIRDLVPSNRVEPRGDVTLRGKEEPIAIYAARIVVPD
jgi:adenylate cyclase